METSKPKVAFIVGAFPSNKMNWLTEQVTSLIDLGVDIQIFTLFRGDPDQLAERVQKYRLLDRTIYMDVPVSRIRRWILFPFMFMRILFLQPKTLWRILSLRTGIALSVQYFFRIAPLVGVIEKYPIVHCHQGMIANKFAAIRDIMKLKQPFLTTFYGQDSSKYIKAKGPHCYDYLIQNQEMLLVMTEEMKERMVAFGFPSSKVKVNYTGIIIGDYQFVPRKYKAGEKFKIIFAGRFVEKKGIPDVLRCFARVLARHPEAELHFFGEGDEEEYNAEIDATLHELKLGHEVVFHGMVLPENLHRALLEMHLMVQLSKTAKNGDTDDLPVVLLEAQATGLPVVTTKHVGIPDGVEDGKTGFLVDEGDYMAAAEKICSVIEHPELLEQMSCRARTFMEEKFDIVEIDKKLITLYEEIEAKKKNTYGN